MPKPRIAVFSGPTATIGNSPPLVTSDKARQAYGLPPLVDAAGAPVRTDVLRPQRLAAPVTVYVEAFSAHPLEVDAAELYAPPDGWVALDGTFSEAAMLKFGALPPASDPCHPTPDEQRAVTEALTAYQEVFETH